jgi:hypothetical protein
MPCDPEKMKKLDALLDEFLSSRRDALEKPEDDDDETESEADTQDDPGLLGKKNAS